MGHLQIIKTLPCALLSIFYLVNISQNIKTEWSQRSVVSPQDVGMGSVGFLAECVQCWIQTHCFCLQSYGAPGHFKIMGYSVLNCIYYGHASICPSASPLRHLSSTDILSSCLEGTQLYCYRYTSALLLPFLPFCQAASIVTAPLPLK